MYPLYRGLFFVPLPDFMFFLAYPVIQSLMNNC